MGVLEVKSVPIPTTSSAATPARTASGTAAAQRLDVVGRVLERPLRGQLGAGRGERASMTPGTVDGRGQLGPVARVDDDRACRQRPEVDADDAAHFAAVPCPLAAIRARRYSLTTISVSSTDVSAVALSSAIIPSWIRFTRSQLASTCT